MESRPDLFIISDMHFYQVVITIGCSFKIILKVGVEDSIVNAPRITDHGSDHFLRCLYFSLRTDEWCVHNFEDKFK
jgi:hypothetical protein